MIMARSVLEVIITEKIQSPANEHGKDKTLNAKLRDAAKEGVISKRLGDLAATIKDVGNGSTHNIFEEISKDYAEFILSFMDTLIEETYQEDGHLAKLASLSQQLKQVKAEKLSINYFKYYDDVLILLKTGLRISELCGLTVADIDFKNEVVIIDHQLLKSKEQGYYIETPKTKSGTRQVPLSKETIQAFQRVIKKRPKAEPFVIDGRGNFLFVNQKGKPKVAIDYNALFVRMVKRYNKQHKDNPLPHITPHTLRHTFCTRLASKNMNPKDLQYIMGHSNISITMNWYAHASIDTAKSEVQRLIA